jgi:tetratricopeptide (TPR) repeat protein
MNIRTIIICALLCAVTTMQAQTPQQVFDQANKLYEQNKFAEARDAYESILRNGYSSGELYYNLGNACYKLGNIAKAILNYERALKEMPNDDDLRHNLQLANLMVTDKIEPTPRLFIWDYWDRLMEWFSLREITWITYALFVLSIGFLIAIIFSPSYRIRRGAALACAASALLLIPALVMFLAKVSDLRSEDAAIVTADITTIKNSPDPKSSDAFVLHNGVKVQITDRLSDWTKIRLADGKVGWMEKSAAEII